MKITKTDVRNLVANDKSRLEKELNEVRKKIDSYARIYLKKSIVDKMEQGGYNLYKSIDTMIGAIEEVRHMVDENSVVEVNGTVNDVYHKIINIRTNIEKTYIYGYWEYFYGYNLQDSFAKTRITTTKLNLLIDILPVEIFNRIDEFITKRNTIYSTFNAIEKIILKSTSGKNAIKDLKDMIDYDLSEKLGDYEPKVKKYDVADISKMKHNVKEIGL